MKSKELKTLAAADQKAKLNEAYKELMQLRAQARSATPKNPGRIRVLRRTIAQLLTIQNNPPVQKIAEATQKP